MSNRRFEMFHYRQIIFRMRQGESDRQIAKAKLMGRLKCGHVREIAEQKGWLDPVPLPEDAELARIFESKTPNPSQKSLVETHAEQVKQWWLDGIQGTTIHQALVNRFGFAGGYSSVRRYLKKLRKDHPQATCLLEFEPGEAAQVDFGQGRRSPTSGPVR